MADSNGQEKTESATPKKRNEQRLEGNVARSIEVVSVTVLALSLAALAFLGRGIMVDIAMIWREYFAGVADVTITPDTVPSLLADTGRRVGLAMAPFFAAVICAGVLANVAQNGFLLTLKPLKPKPSRLNPITGAKRVFSKRGLVELVKSLLKIAIVAGVVLWAMSNTIDSFLPLMQVPLFFAYGAILTAMLKMSAAAALALVLVAILDFFFQRHEYENQIKMTKQEVKEERKQSEGDPLIKSKIRSKQMDMSRQRMMQNVKDADVVVTNPIHFAVALKYDPLKGPAPRVVAKGARLVAKKIRDTALEAGIPIVEDPPLARALFKACRLGADVPLSMYKAVAELLAFVYRKRDAVPGGVR